MVAALSRPEQVVLAPQERAILMIEACANQIFKATTLKDVLLAITQAEAIALIVRKIEASKRVKEDDAFLLINAERQLGELRAKIPKKNAGKGSKGPVRPGPSKKETLAKHGININRALRAEALARVPESKVELAVERAKYKTVNGVQAELGIKHQTPWRSKDAVLAEDAIALLKECCKKRRPPRQDEVNKFELRLAALRVK